MRFLRIAAAAVLLGGVLVAGSASSAGSSLFSENFENGLSGWTGKAGGQHHGVIVDDPLRSGNHVLEFTVLNSAGDIFSAPIPVSRTTTYELKFDYLGKPGTGGGYVGISLGTPDDHRWLVAPPPPRDGEEANPLVDDGQWHTYAIDFVPGGKPWSTPDGSRRVVPPSITALRIMLEANFGNPGDAYFDNISLDECTGDCAVGEEPLKANVSFHANSLPTAPPRDGRQCPGRRARAKVTGHIESQITEDGDHQGGGHVADFPHRARCRVPVIDFAVDHVGLSVITPGKKLKVVLKVHISQSAVHRPGDCRVGTKGSVTLIYDDTKRARNSLRNDSLRIGPWQGRCSAHTHRITNNISRKTAHSHGSTWVTVFIGCLAGPGTGYSPRNCGAS